MSRNIVSRAAMPEINTGNRDLIAHPITVIHQDGTTETVYLLQLPPQQKKKIADHFATCYLAVGILALSLSVILSFRQIKKGNG